MFILNKEPVVWTDGLGGLFHKKVGDYNIPLYIKSKPLKIKEIKFDQDLFKSLGRKLKRG